MGLSPFRILVLGGTTEATALVRRLAAEPGLVLCLSLAGRTAAPTIPPVALRVGGFGGAEGLARYLHEEGIGAVVDATHPFAALISRNAVEAARRADVPLLALRRPPWERRPGDRWIEVGGMGEAVAALGDTPRRVFLTVGRQDLAPFSAAPRHRYLVRSIEPVGDSLAVPHRDEIRARGPFAEADEIALMRREGVEVVVSKNAGAAATYAKIAAARHLGLPVVMLCQPEKPAVETVAEVEAAASWCLKRAGRAHAASTRREV